jgi:hypothetical protein
MTIINDPNEDTCGNNAHGGGGTTRIGLANPGDNDDYNALDIIGHEFTHSVVETSAGLTYDATKESNALNESFCDIFGQMVEQWIEGGAKKEWVIGDDRGCGQFSCLGKTFSARCRDLQTPKNFNNPDTYKGINWQTASATSTPDPHNNGSVQNRWFALLCDGGSGTNTELSSAYNVNGVGMVKGRKIAYRGLTRYLNSDATYADAREASISAASDLYGADSSEVESVTNAWCAVGLCPYVIPTKADIFDTPGGNPNPASPNNNNSIGGATPIGTGNRIFGTGSYPWSSGKQPLLRIQNLSIYPANDVDYFNITFPDVKGLNGRCFSSGFAFDFGTKVNARIFVNGVVTQNYVDTSFFSVGVSIEPTPIVLEITAPFPGQILTYNLSIAFFLHYKSDCFQPGMPNIWDEIRNCPMCDLQVLKGFDRVILDPLYRQPDKVDVSDHYFYWKGEGPLQIPVSVLQGNNLHAELVNEAGEIVANADRNGPNDLLINAPQTRPGVYSLRFSGFGNGTEILVRTPRQELTQ